MHEAGQLMVDVGKAASPRRQIEHRAPHPAVCPLEQRWRAGGCIRCCRHLPKTRPSPRAAAAVAQHVVLQQQPRPHRREVGVEDGGADADGPFQEGGGQDSLTGVNFKITEL